MPNAIRRTADRRLAARLRLSRRALTWAGVAMSAVGLMTIILPAATSLLIGAVVGWALWLAGGLMIVVSFLVRESGSFFGSVLTGFLAVAAGAYLFFHPQAGAAALVILLVGVLVVDGAFQLALALDLRPLAPWRWVLGSAIASALAALLLAAGATQDSRPSIGLVLGVSLISTGIALLAIGRGGAPRRALRPAT